MRYVITNKKVNALAIHDPERQREQERCFDMQPNGLARREATQQNRNENLGVDPIVLVLFVIAANSRPPHF